MSFSREMIEFARRDLIAERRAGEILTIVIPFAAVALMAFPLAFGVDAGITARVGPALFWIVVWLFTMQVSLRYSATDQPHHRAALALIGGDPLARLAGRTVAATALIWSLMVVLFPTMILFFSPDLPPGWPRAAVPAALAGLGLAQLGVLAAELTAGLRTRSSLSGLLTAPLGIPFLMVGAQPMESLTRGDSILAWTLLALAANLALAVTAALVARPLEEASR